MTPKNLPSRLSAVDLSKLWLISTTRISQFKNEGKIKRGDDGKFDRDECLAFRATQLGEQQVNVMFQHYGNAHSSTPPKIVDHFAAAGKEAWTDDQLLGLEPPPSSDAMTKALNTQTGLMTLRQTDLRLTIERKQRAEAKEAGLLMERATVYKEFAKAGATIQGLLRTLEHQIPTKFTDPLVRIEARNIVQNAVDRSLHAMAKALAKFGADSSEPDDADFQEEPSDD